MNHITITPDEQTFDQAASWRIVRCMHKKPDAVIGLSTGRTTGNLHRLVGRMCTEFPFDYHSTTFFGVDEIANVPQTYSGACYTMLKTQLIETLGVDAEHFLMLPSQSDDYVRDCAAFEAELSRRGGIDLLMLGLGENGHLGFNQPGTPFESRTWVAQMTAELEERVRRETGIPSDQWLGGATLGLKNMMQARHIVLVAKGEHKAEIVRRMLTDNITPALPATILQLHPHCEFLLDAAAARLILSK